MADTISSHAQLDALYGAPVPAALTKETDRLIEGHRRYIEASPFVLLATSGDGGLDCTPRGDAPGFVHIVDDRTLHLPDRRGNNRIDSLHNIVDDPRVALLFVVPGVGTTLRVNGTAQILVDEELARRYAVDGKEPRTVLEIAVERAFSQCPKALVRSHLWDAERHRSAEELPTVGQILAEIDETFDGATYDRNYPGRLTETLY